MLTSKKYNANDIVSFKLVNGDEIIGTIVSEFSDGYTITRPCIAIPSHQGLALMQAVMSGDINTNVTLNKSHVVMHVPTIDKVQAHYIRTTTGIETAPNGGIIT